MPSTAHVSSGVELVRSIPARDLVGAGENAGEGVDEHVGDALAFECLDERGRVAPRLRPAAVPARIEQ
jgi:hypothetical protein